MTYEERWGHPRSRRANGSARRAKRHQEAKVRQAKYDSLSTEQYAKHTTKKYAKLSAQ